MTDAELLARLRLYGSKFHHEFGHNEAAADRIEQLVATNETLIADLARSTRMIAKMVPLSADGNYVFWDGVGDIELDHNGELRKTIEALEAKLAENEARLGKAVEALDYCINAPFSGWTIAQGYARAALAALNHAKETPHE